MWNANRRRFSLVVVLLLGAAVGLAQTQLSEVPRVQIKQVAKVQPNGDIVFTNELTFPLRIYNNLRSSVGSTAMLLRAFGVSGEIAELKDARADYDDGAHAVKLSATILGACKNQGKEWFWEVPDANEYTVADAHDQVVTLQVARQLDVGLLLAGTMRIEVPAGATPTFDPKRNGLFVQMPPPPSETPGTVALDLRMDVRDKIMSCVYKAYGNPKLPELWVARAVLRNNGTAALTDFRIRFKLGDYSAWSQWYRSGNVYPSQTIVEAFFPIMDAKVAQLTSQTPASLQYEWSYKTPDGKDVNEADSRRLSILGINEIISSSLKPEEVSGWLDGTNNIPLVEPAFVAHNDPIIQQFAGMAAEAAGGPAAGQSDAEALKFMKGVYELMVANGIKYITAPGVSGTSMFFQHVKYGRDVLRAKAGTCIDLAILYASVCQAGGLQPLLMNIPGHTFPVIKMPEGGMYAVEVTAVNNAAPFERAVEYAGKEFNEAREKGLFYLVDITQRRLDGIPPPELPALPPDSLTAWGIKPMSQLKRPDPIKPIDDGKPQPPGDFQQLSDPNGVYTLGVPKHYNIRQQGQMLVAGDPQGVFGISCVSMSRDAQSLEAFAEKTAFNLRQGIADWQEVERVNVQVSGAPALAIRATGRPNGQSLEGVYILVVTNQHQLALIFQYPVGGLQQAAPLINQIVASWRIRM